MEQLDKQFRAWVRLGDQHFASTYLEKNKKFAKQGVALVAVKCLTISPSIGLKGIRNNKVSSPEDCLANPC